MQPAALLQSPPKTPRHEPSTQNLSGKRNCGTVRHHPRRACFALGVPLFALAVATITAAVAGAQLQPEQVVKEDTVGNREHAKGGALAALLRENARLRKSLAGCERSKGHRATASGMRSGVLLLRLASLTRRNAMLVQENADLRSRLEDSPSHGMPCAGHLAATSNAPEAIVLGGTRGPIGPPVVHHTKTQTLRTVPSSGALVGLPSLPACGRPAVGIPPGVGLSRRGHRAPIIHKLFASTQPASHHTQPHGTSP